jgi:hypothetical protein
MAEFRSASPKKAGRAPVRAPFAGKKDDLIGSVIKNGRYQILDVLGAGGMGSVYRARDIKTGKEVAVKVLKDSLGNTDAVERFFREVKAAIQVHHQNIVEIHDYGQHRDKLYCVMELLEGKDLLKILDESDGRKLPWETVKPIVLQMCRGLGAAHKLRIIHRDLKPGNIIIVPNGGKHGVKIVDFGLAKQMDNRNDNLTRTGTIMGTVSYMAPEQTLGKADAYDHRVDVWAVGIMMYEMLTGKKPFRGDNALETIAKIQHETPRKPAEINPDIPGNVERIILKAIQKDPKERFQSMTELLRVIEYGDTRVGIGDGLLFEMVKSHERPPEINNDGIIPALVLGVARGIDYTERPAAPAAAPNQPKYAFVESMEAVRQFEPQEIQRSRGWVGWLAGAVALTAVVAIGAANIDRITRFVSELGQASAAEGEETSEEQTTQFRATIKTTPSKVSIHRQKRNGRLGKRLTTIQGGSATLILENGEHRFIVAKQGYAWKKVTVTPQNPDVEVTLRRVRKKPAPTPKADAVELDPVDIGDTE